MKQYCMYLRKSRADMEAEAHGEGETLARHERILMEYAKRNKINVTKIYPEVESGETIASRPVMQQVLNEVEQGIWAGVLVMEVERLARGDTIDQGIVAQTFKYSNTKIITPMKIYDPNNEFDEEYFEFGLFMSRREYKTTRRRLRNGVDAASKEGKWPFNKAPYGYKRKKIENDKGYTLEIVPNEAAVVRMIFELYTVGEEQDDRTIKRLGSTLISNKLNKLNIPSAENMEWIPVVILDILKNPVYAGKIRRNYKPEVKKMQEGTVTKKRTRNSSDKWQLYDGLHDAIVDKDLFERTQELLEQNKPKPVPGNKSMKNPLTGLIICGCCGSKMVRRPYPDRTPDAMVCPKSGCKNISSYLSYIENRILVSLKQWLIEYKLQLSIENKQQINNTEIEVKKQIIKKLEEEIANLNKQLNNIHDLLEQGIYSTATFMERSKINNEKLNEATKKLNTAIKSLEDDSKTYKSIVEFIPKVEHVLEVYDSVEDPEIKNTLLDEVVSKAVYTKTKRVGKDKNFDDFELIVYPRIPK